ncbi:MAG: hypothetical protein GC206_13165 [Alphaproteobacteria bacterium]|nr:hypothetical protein [Alphaproteobacteria bacterium]
MPCLCRLQIASAQATLGNLNLVLPNLPIPMLPAGLAPALMALKLGQAPASTMVALPTLPPLNLDPLLLARLLGLLPTLPLIAAALNVNLMSPPPVASTAWQNLLATIAAHKRFLEQLMAFDPMAIAKLLPLAALGQLAKLAGLDLLSPNFPTQLAGSLSSLPSLPRLTITPPMMPGLRNLGLGMDLNIAGGIAVTAPALTLPTLPTAGGLGGGIAASMGMSVAVPIPGLPDLGPGPIPAMSLGSLAITAAQTLGIRLAAPNGMALLVAALNHLISLVPLLPSINIDLSKLLGAQMVASTILSLRLGLGIDLRLPNALDLLKAALLNLAGMVWPEIPPIALPAGAASAPFLALASLLDFKLLGGLNLGALAGLIPQLPDLGIAAALASLITTLNEALAVNLVVPLGPCKAGVCPLVGHSRWASP